MRKIVLICSLYSILVADPSTSFKYLINEPLTMLEWGLNKLTHKLNDGYYYEKLEYETQKRGGYAQYNWSKNQLVLSIVTTVRSNIINKKDVCKTSINDIKKAFYIDGMSSLRKYQGISSFFMHDGFSNDKPVNFDLDIEKNTLIDVTVRFMTKGSGYYNTNLRCEGFLLNDKILFTE